MQGIAKTGSGKTAAFVLPMVVHIMDQPELQASAVLCLCVRRARAQWWGGQGARSVPLHRP